VTPPVIADRRPPTNPSGSFSTAGGEDERAAVEGVADLTLAADEPLADEPLAAAEPS
jgi:hypothetical protein